MSLSAAVAVSSIVSRQALGDWLDLPGRLQGSDPCWVAPLRVEQKKLLDRRANPFFKRADAEFFIAHRGGRAVGRVSAHSGLPMAGFDTSRTGSFGFFECEDDAEAAGALFAAAEGWLAARAVREVLGPMNFSMNQECGLLVDGFDSPPFIMMGHNPPRYQALIEGQGYTKRKDLFAWRYDVRPIPERLARLADRTLRTSNLKFRTLDRANFDADARIVLRIFNEAWRNNWGFTPMIEEEFDKTVRELRRIVDPALVLIAEKEGQPVAIAVSLPNLNEALSGLRGRLLPFGFVKLLWRLKVRGTRTVRCLMLGIEESARGRSTPGLSLLLFVKMSEAGAQRGIAWGEMSWTLEDNDPINSGIVAMGATRYKTYRIYSKALPA